MSSGFFFSLTALVAAVLALVTLAFLKIDDKHRAFDCDVQDTSDQLIAAKVHYMDWSILTPIRYGVERVREIPSIELFEGPRLDCLTAAIAMREMNMPIRSAGPMNGRILVVGSNRDGDRIEIYADRFRICSLTDDVCRENDELTRARIAFVLEAPGW